MWMHPHNLLQKLHLQRLMHPARPLILLKVWDHACLPHEALLKPAAWDDGIVCCAALKLGSLRLANVIRSKPAVGSAAGQLQEQEGASGEGAVVARIRATAAG